MGQPLFVLVGMLPGLQQAIGAGQLRRLHGAHPNVRVEVVDEPARFTTEILRANGAILDSGFVSLLGPALRADGRLRWVHSAPAGVNRLLTPELVSAEHVMVTSSKGPMGPMMAEHIVLLMLALARDLPGFVRDQADHHWRHLSDERPMADLFGRTICILGVGSVGRQLARICQAGFGMRVLGLSRTRRDSPYVDQYVDQDGLYDALAESDVVSLSLPLTTATRRIVDARALAAMKQTALLINVARGGLIDEAALIEAIRDGRIAGAGLDALESEPPDADSALWDLPNVIITPHVASGRDRLGSELVAFWCENIRRFAEGEPLQGLVDRHAGY